MITDALDMKAIVDFSKGDYPDITALNAGNDLLLMPSDVAKSIKEIKKAYQKNKISPQRLESAVKKILYAKYKAGLSDLKPVEIDNIVDDLNHISPPLSHSPAQLPKCVRRPDHTAATMSGFFSHS